MGKISNSNPKSVSPFYCKECFAYEKAECFCDRTISYDLETDIPIVNFIKKEWGYIYSSKWRKGGP